MIAIDNWITALTEKLKNAFADRLLFVGSQCNYLKGEVNEESDIDVLVILDALFLADLKQFKNILAIMPNQGKACGFVSGN